MPGHSRPKGLHFFAGRKNKKGVDGIGSRACPTSE
jgi:hypothetical protein